MTPIRHRSVVLIAIGCIVAACCTSAFAQKRGLEWINGYLEVSVSYKDGAVRRRLRVVSDPTTFCMWESASEEQMKKEFGDAVSSAYSRFPDVQFSNVVWRGLGGAADAKDLYNRAISRKDGHDEVVQNGFVNTIYSKRCK